MPVIRLHPPFDHGAALRVPPAHDQKNWAVLWHWLGEDAQSVAEASAVQVRTPEGWKYFFGQASLGLPDEAAPRR